MKGLLFSSFVLFLLFSNSSYAQSEFPHGMYIRGYTGIYQSSNTGEDYSHYPVINSGAEKNLNSLSLWYKKLGLNTFNMLEAYDIKRFNYIPYLYNSSSNYNKSPNQKVGEKITPIFCDYFLEESAESHYIDFNPQNKSDNSLQFGKSAGGFSVNPATYEVVFKGGKAGYSGEIISGCQTKGSNRNNNLIRPRPINTTGANADFMLKIEIGDYSGTAGNEVLVSILNDKPDKVKSDINDHPVSDYRVAINQNGLYTVPFTLNKGMGSAYEFYFNFSIKANFTNDIRFTIKNIILCDESGYRIVKENQSGSFFHKTQQNYIYDLITKGFGRADLPRNSGKFLLQLADEPTIGNFLPTKIILDRINKLLKPYGKSCALFSTAPQYSAQDESGLRANIDRFIRDVHPDIIAPDIYPFRSYWRDKPYPEIIDKFYSPLSIISQEVNKYNSTAGAGKIELWSVLQIQSDKAPFVKPTTNELLSTIYISLMQGYKGILYYWSGPDPDKVEQGLYRYDINPPISAMSNEERYLKLNTLDDPAYVDQNIKNAILKVTEFLNKKIAGKNNQQTAGNLLKSAQASDWILIGNDKENKRVNEKKVAIEGNKGIKLSRVGIVNPKNPEILSADDCLMGAAAVTMGKEKYYLLVNLGQESKDLSVRLNFELKKGKSVKLNDLTKENEARTITPKGEAMLKIPAAGAVLIKAE